MKHLSPEAQAIRNEGIINDYKQGLTRQELCMKYGMSCVGRVLKNAGIKFAKKGGRRRVVQQDKDRLWVDKQIVALTKQGLSTIDIMGRYNIAKGRIQKVRKEHNTHLQTDASLQKNMLSINGMAIPDLTPLITVQPKHRWL